MTTANTVADLRAALKAQYPENDEPVDALNYYTLEVSLTTSADASTPVAEHGWTGIPFAGTVVAAYATQASAVTGATNAAANINLIARDAAGANNVTVGTKATPPTAVAMAAYAGHALTLTAANTAVVAGGSLSLTVSKTGAGISSVGGNVTVVIRRDA